MPDSILPLSEIVTPADQTAAVEAVRAAVAAGTPIYPLGGRTNICYGANARADGALKRTPQVSEDGALKHTLQGSEDGVLKRTLQGSGVGICTEKLNRVVDHAERDLTVTVEAGVTVAKLAKILAAKNQRLPVDVPQAARATVGGAMACGAAGPRRFRCGTMRDYVIGFQAVDGTGKTFAGGGRVVKNAAGYDMCRLLTGSLGTLGLVTQVTLMVKPLPRRSAFLACRLADFDTAERMLADLVQSETLPAAVELLCGPAWEDDAALGVLGNEAAHLVVAFEGSEADVEWMLESLARQWRQAVGREPVVVEKSQIDPLWNRLVEFPTLEAAAADGCERPLIVQIAALPGKMISLVEQLRRLSPGASIQVHAGDGVVRARFPLSASDVENGGAKKLLEEKIRPLAAAAEGRTVVLAYPPQAKMDQKTVWGSAADRTQDATAPAVGVMRAVKERFDPQNLLNPGRFIF